MAMKLVRLQEIQKENLEKCLDSINKWQKFSDDYHHLKDRLTTIADRLDYDVMVPFGSVAFMPGKLKHTNEIMVLLGDNLFVERSAKQACEILQRRIDNCEAQLAKLDQEKKQIEDWSLATNAINDEEGLVDIVEEYNEEVEKEWRERRKKEKKTRGDEPVGVSHEQLMEKLDELKLEEEMERFKDLREEAKYLPNVDVGTPFKETAVVDLSCASVEEKSKVRWKDEVARDTSAEVKVHSANFTFSSPADIYAYHQLISEPKPLKSILKSVPSNRSSNVISTGVRPKSKIEPRSKAVSNTSYNTEKKIKWNSTSLALTDVVMERDTSSKPVVTNGQPERVSLFKSKQRLGH